MYYEKDLGILLAGVMAVSMTACSSAKLRQPLRRRQQRLKLRQRRLKQQKRMRQRRVEAKRGSFRRADRNPGGSGSQPSVCDGG